MDDIAFRKRLKVLQREHYLFEIDEYGCGEQQMLLAHLRVSKFSPAIMKSILRDWRMFREKVSAPIFVAPHDETGQPVDLKKWERFVSLLGFKPLPNGMYLHYGHEHSNPKW